MCVRFRARSRDRHPLVHNEAEYTGQRLLDRRAAHFAVTLGAVWVTRVEESPGLKDRKVEGRPGLQILHVEIAAKGARRPRPLHAWHCHPGLAYRRVRWGDGQDAHEWGQRHMDVGREERDFATVDLTGPDQMPRA